jgi:hypothetical protein
MNKINNLDLILLVIISLIIVRQCCKSKRVREQFANQEQEQEQEQKQNNPNYTEALIGDFAALHDTSSSEYCTKEHVIGSFTLPDNFGFFKEARISMLSYCLRIKPNGVSTYDFKGFDKVNFPVIYSISDGINTVPVTETHIVSPYGGTDKVFDWTKIDLDFSSGREYTVSVRVCPSLNSIVSLKLRHRNFKFYMRYYTLDVAGSLQEEGLLPKKKYIEKMIVNIRKTQDVRSDTNCTDPVELTTFTLPDDFATLDSIQLTTTNKNMYIRDNGSGTYAMPDRYHARYPITYSISDGYNTEVLGVNIVVYTSNNERTKKFPWKMLKNIELIPGRQYKLICTVCPKPPDTNIIKVRVINKQITIRYHTSAVANTLLWKEMIKDNIEASNPPKKLCIGDTCVDEAQLHKIISVVNTPPKEDYVPDAACIIS